MTGLHAWVDGSLVDAGEARVSVFDRAFRSGEGVFETFRSYRGSVFRLDGHLERAEAGARAIGFSPPSREDLRRAVAETARVNLPAMAGADAALRLNLTPGPIDPASPWPGAPTGSPTLVVTAHPLSVPESLYREGTSAVGVTAARALPQVKAVSYLAATLARREAHDQGADEALLTDRDGNVLEGSASNVFAAVDGRLVTPPVDVGILAGVTRGVVLEVAEQLGLEVQERTLGLQELVGSAEAFLTATTREVVPLVRVGSEQVGDGRPGPLTARIHAAYRGIVESETAGVSRP